MSQGKLQSDALCGFPIKVVLLCVYSIHVATVEVPVVRVNQNKDNYINMNWRNEYQRIITEV